VLALASKQVGALAVLGIIQAAFMAGYGVFMVIAQGVYAFAPARPTNPGPSGAVATRS
jgi:hypothetical protein